MSLCALHKNEPKRERVSPKCHLWDTELLHCVKQSEKKATRCLEQHNPQYFHQNTEPHSIYIDLFSICWGSGFSSESRTFSIQINMGDGRLGNQGYFTRPSMIWDQMTCLWVSAPTRTARGDLCALLWFYTGYVCLCYEKGAMSSFWKYAGFCGYFSFLSNLSFDFFWDPFLLLTYFAFLGK